MKFTRITVDPSQMGGVPCIRGLRIPVATVVGMVADGMPAEEILKSFPDLEHKGIQEALQYASEAVRERKILLVTSAWTFLDNAFSPIFSDGLRKAGHNAIHVRSYGLQSADDITIFSRAALDNRILPGIQKDLERGRIIVFEETRIRIR